MKRHYYNAETLLRRMRAFEKEYGITSEEFIAAYRADRELPGIPRSTQAAWAGFYDNVERMQDRA